MNLIRAWNLCFTEPIVIKSRTVRFFALLDCSERVSAFTGLTLIVITLVGCADYSVSAEMPVGGYKYTPVIRDRSGHYVSGVPASPNEIAFYQYGFRRAELEKISPDMKVAVKAFIERHQAIPPECTKGIRIAKINTVENASLLTANVECEQGTGSPISPLRQN